MNHVKIIKTAADHERALARLDELMDMMPAEGSAPADELELLAMLIGQYEEKAFPIDKPTALEAIQFRMKQQGLQNKDLIPYIGSAPKVSEILNGKRPLSLNMIRKLHAGLGIPADVLIQDDQCEAALSDGIDYRLFPLAEMRKRSYIAGFSGTLAELKEYAAENIKAFLGGVGLSMDAFNGDNSSPALLLRTSAHQADNNKEYDPYALLVWQAQVLHLAKRKPLKTAYVPGSVTREWLQDLAKLSALQQGPVLAVEYLNNAGIQLVFEKHMPKTYLDGAVCMPSPNQPVIALTLRHNRVDNFWFTLMHELAHLSLHFAADKDSKHQWIVDDLDKTSADPREQEADALAQEILIPKESLSRGIPDSDTGIRELAARLRINPAIIAGRARRESGDYKRHPAFFGKGYDVRDMIQAAGLADL